MAAPVNPTNITPPRVAFIDDRTGAISREWYRWFLSLFTQVEINSGSIVASEASEPLAAIAGLDAALRAVQGAALSQPAQPDHTQAVQALAQAIQTLPRPAPVVAPVPVVPPGFDPAPLLRRINTLSAAPAVQPPAPSGAGVVPTTVTPGASPYSYINTSSYAASLIVQGGTVTLIEFSRNGTTFFDTGVLAGMFALSPYDRLRITYAIAPTVTLVPR